MTRRPLFWIVFGALGLAGAITAVRLFTTALPNVSLDIEMDREGAIAAAESLSRVGGWGPGEARSAASFGQVDPEVQTYVELEGGGRDAFQALMDAGAYQPYQWRVRRFAEGEAAEVEVRFTPAGEPYGFRLRLAEDDPGAGNLEGVEARALAEREAAAWPIDLAPYELVESSQETLPGGRVDHTFVYERDDVELADAGFRLRLVVAGDRLGELTHFVFVPEAFGRRYAEMRSTNDAIALVAQSVFILLYVLLGAGLGTALLLRERWVEWRTPLVWGAATALLFGLNALNALPLAWMEYDTALGAGTFVLQNVAAAVAIIVLGTPVLGFFFMAGESLGRRAFPDHLQQWRFWSREVASSRPGLGFTVAAYLLVGLQLGYVVLFYLGTSKLEGWWSPADALVQPDLLATYLPWLQAVSISLFASLWEESIFRAVPIACAALLGARYGRRAVWIWGAVFVQALVFAAGHANYPQQPPYARVVELFLPAFVWGAVYVRYGLVPTILAHFLYDLSLISSVLFASRAFTDQGVIVLVAAVPLGVVLWARRGGRSSDGAPEWAHNRAWTPAEASAPSEERPAAVGESEVGPASAAEGNDVRREAAEEVGALRGPSIPTWLTPAAGVLGLALWAVALVTTDRSEALRIGRPEAIDVARSELARLGFELEGWNAYASAGGGRSDAHRYVFEEGGPEAFEAQVGEFLAPPQWIVRFVDWDADPEERVEEFVVNLRADGSIRRVAHTLPEGRDGASLEEDEARALARGALPPGAWREVGAEETSLEARRDWTFTFQETSVLTGVAGEARASVAVLGDEVTDLRRFVDVPEEWERREREASTRRSMVGIGLVFVLVLLYGAAAVVAIVVWSRRRLDVRPLWRAGVLATVAMTLSLGNGWVSAPASFSTEQPYDFQAGAAAFGFVLITLVAAAAVGLVVALGHSWADASNRPAPPRVLGPALGALAAGVGGVVGALSGGMPAVSDYSGAASYVPMLAPVLDSVMPLLFVTSALLVLSAAHRRFVGHPVPHAVTGFGIFAVAVVIVPDALQESWLLWALAGVVAVGAVWVLTYVVGLYPQVAPAFVATLVALEAVKTVLGGPYPGAAAGHVVAAVLVGVLGWAWVAELRGPGGPPARPDPSSGSRATSRSAAPAPEASG